jgi:adenylate cyclase
LERRLAAILAADVAGYTALMGTDEAGTLQRLTDLRREFLEPLIADHHGRVVKVMGDGLLLEFASVVDAVACALAWQDGMAGLQEEAEEEKQLRFRIGINVGDVIVEDGDIHGDGVNIAARLEGMAEPGGICLSGDAYRQARAKVEAEFEDLGDQNLKNVSEPVRVYRVAGECFSNSTYATGQEPLALPDRPSIAVLPFTNMSGNKGEDYFSDGITEDIITELSRFSSLFVIARNSSFAYKGRSVDVRQVAQQLGVRYILEGSIRRANNRIRITAQLIDSETGNHIWAERYDRDFGDIFALQDEITREVVGSIAPQIELAELERGRRLRETNVSAYERALKAQALTYDAGRLADANRLVEAMSVARDALTLDERSTHALWTFGMGCVFQHVYGWSDDPAGTLNRAVETADRMISIDPSNAKSYVLRAWAHQYRREYELALADYRRALDLNPNLALNLITMAWSEAVAGLATDAREHAQTALRLSPRDTDIWLGWAYAALEVAGFIEDNFAEAVKWGRLAIQMHGQMPFRRVVMVAACGHLDDAETARSHVEALRAFAPKFLPAVLSSEIEVFKLPKHNALLIEGLRKAGL